MTFLGENKNCENKNKILLTFFSNELFLSLNSRLKGRFCMQVFERYFMHNILGYFKRTNLISTIIVIIF